MKTLFKTLVTCAIFATSLSALATETTWDFRTSGQRYGSGNSFGNTMTKSAADITVNMTAWADTRRLQNGSQLIQNAKIASNSNGLLNYNRSNNDAHTIDSWCGGCHFDFILLSFSEAVNLASISLGWSDFNTERVSVGAFSVDASAPTLVDKTWGQVAGDLAAKTVVEVSNARRASSTNLVTAATGLTQYSQYWLIGAYHSAFRNLGHNIQSAFKIAGITTHVVPTTPNDPDGTTPGTPVNSPATIALFGLGLMVLWSRRSQS